jgi:hypothetical protein
MGCEFKGRMSKKRCSLCNTEKPLNQFRKNRSHKDGHHSCCRECESIRDKKRRETAKEFVAECKKSCSCFCCELKDFRCMEFHHFNPSAKHFSITDAIAYRKPPSSIRREIDKCLPVCANCHRIIHIECTI